jgi:hypothetical protein
MLTTMLVDSGITIPNEKGQDSGVMDGSPNGQLPLSILIAFPL